MNEIKVKVGKNIVEISKRVFISLLNSSYVREYVAYKHALRDGEISFEELKTLASKGAVPYPLFFAPLSQVEMQIIDNDENLFQKLPSKDEIRLIGRGGFHVEDVMLIAKDLARKQEFLKKRVLPEVPPNIFIGYIGKKVKQNQPISEIANDIRNYLGIDLNVLRSKSKAEVIRYIVECAENRNILVSFSSYNFMPQNLSRELGLSGLCIKDKQFPFIFINNRDGDQRPKILETEGRQTFTLVMMLTCLAMNRFVLSSKKPSRQDSLSKKIFQIAGEILVPRIDLVDVEIIDIDDLKKEATRFKVTPSMFLSRMSECKLITSSLARSLRKVLEAELKSIPESPKHQPLMENGYAKYNGNRFSKEIINAFRNKKISISELKNILFLRTKVGPDLIDKYSKKFK